jgi:3-methyladenine DNA glycosylase AlkC
MTANAITLRKGARRIAEIPPTVLAALNRGETEARNLVEGLAVDFPTLLRAAVPRLPKEATEAMRAAAGSGITQRMALAGKLLLEHLGPTGYLALVRHRSDTVRSWAAYLLAASPDFSLGERIQLIRVLANDHNSGVRECAWLALRPHIAANIELAIDLLEAWTVSASPFLRRFASEATRPRGVWCRKIDLLVQQPDLGLPVIEPLRADSHQYVQDSVANWLNDAAKSRPDWVRRTCRRWQKESGNAATDRICRRAMRSFESSPARN